LERGGSGARGYYHIGAELAAKVKEEKRGGERCVTTEGEDVTKKTHRKGEK